MRRWLVSRRTQLPVDPHRGDENDRQHPTRVSGDMIGRDQHGKDHSPGIVRTADNLRSPNLKRRRGRWQRRGSQFPNALVPIFHSVARSREIMDFARIAADVRSATTST